MYKHRADAFGDGVDVQLIVSSTTQSLHQQPLPYCSMLLHNTATKGMNWLDQPICCTHQEMYWA